MPIQSVVPLEDKKPAVCWRIVLTQLEGRLEVYTRDLAGFILSTWPLALPFRLLDGSENTAILRWLSNQ